MRIHSNSLTRLDLTDALREAGLTDVWLEDCSLHRSNSHARGYEVRLAAEPRKGRRRRNTGTHGAEDAYQPAYLHAATYDEHGAWMARLFAKDSNATVGPYRGEDNFHASTRYAYVID